MQSVRLSKNRSARLSHPPCLMCILPATWNSCILCQLITCIHYIYKEDTILLMGKHVKFHNCGKLVNLFWRKSPDSLQKKNTSVL